jgi:hypothetical protein
VKQGGDLGTDIAQMLAENRSPEALTVSQYRN